MEHGVSESLVAERTEVPCPDEREDTSVGEREKMIST
jgi:hypothetical protein